jgi:hypothetical protein
VGDVRAFLVSKKALRLFCSFAGQPRRCVSLMACERLPGAFAPQSRHAAKAWCSQLPRRSKSCKRIAPRYSLPPTLIAHKSTPAEEPLAVSAVGRSVRCASTFLRARYVSRVAIPPNGSVADWDQVDTGSVADLQPRVCCTVIVGHHKPQGAACAGIMRAAIRKHA